MAYGRWRLLFSLLTKPSSLKTSDPEYKQELAHTLTALGLSVGFSLFTRDMFSRDSYLDKRLEYLSQSLSQGLSPLDMSQDVSKGSQVLLFTKTNELVQGLAEVFTDGLLKGERTQAGNIPGMAQVTRNIPWLGA